MLGLLSPSTCRNLSLSLLCSIRLSPVAARSQTYNKFLRGLPVKIIDKCKILNQAQQNSLRRQRIQKLLPQARTLRANSICELLYRSVFRRGSDRDTARLKRTGKLRQLRRSIGNYTMAWKSLFGEQYFIHNVHYPNIMGILYRNRPRPETSYTTPFSLKIGSAKKYRQTIHGTDCNSQLQKAQRRMTGSNIFTAPVALTHVDRKKLNFINGYSPYMIISRKGA